MPALTPLLALLAAQGGQDAAEFYADLQRRIAGAKGVQLEWYTGPDSWDSSVTEIYVKPNYAFRTQKNYRHMMDGKWLLINDLGEVTHRRMEKSDLP